MAVAFCTTQVDNSLGDKCSVVRVSSIPRFSFFPRFLLAGALAMIASASSADDAASRLHLLPFIIDGEGIQSRLLVTNISESSSHCSLDFTGPEDFDPNGFYYEVEPEDAGSFSNASIYYKSVNFSCRGGYRGGAAITIRIWHNYQKYEDTANFTCT